MKFSINCFYDASNGANFDEMIYLGNVGLVDKYTYDHYLSLLNGKIPFAISFEVFDFIKGEFNYHNFNVDYKNTFFAEAPNGSGDSIIILYTNERQNHSFLSQEEYNDTQKLNDLLKDLSKRDLSQYFK